MLKIGAILNFIIAIGHLLCLFCLEQVFRIYGITEIMNKIATYNETLPYILTAIIALCFFISGLYALSADGTIRKLSLLKLGIFSLATVFLLRAIIDLVTLIYKFSMLEFSSTTIAMIIGLLYLLGGIKKLHA
jgi:hypothetical protein